jgi:hypothetical protein
MVPRRRTTRTFKVTLAYSEDRFGVRRTAAGLIAWWLVTVVGLVVIAHDQSQRFFSATPHPPQSSVSHWAILGGAWLMPGVVLGGWKAILVATGRSSVSRRRDRVAMRLFAGWVICWALLAYTITLTSAGTL